MNIISSIIHNNGGLEKGDECLVNIDEKQQIINAIGGKNQRVNYIMCSLLVNYVHNESLKKNLINI